MAPQGRGARGCQRTYRGSELTDQMNFTKDCREIRSMLPISVDEYLKCYGACEMDHKGRLAPYD